MPWKRLGLNKLLSNQIQSKNQHLKVNQLLGINLKITSQINEYR